MGHKIVQWGQLSLRIAPLLQERIAQSRPVMYVLVQVVKIGIMPQLATPSRRQEAEPEVLHPARQLHERR